ncbi:MAG: hypothetical protein LBH36_00535 [Candidatus Nomurabacteria bacterium]|nr:hypothetical protein [Candidatus Nomurabacteria bacterium]
MIEINLIPDVKRELLKAQRMRSVIVSVSILVGVVSVGVVIALGVIVFLVQGIAGKVIDDNITSEHNKLQDRADTIQVLTIQQQLGYLAGLEGNKYMVSRIIGAVNAIRESASDPAIQLSKLGFLQEGNIVTIEGQAVQGFEALDAFIKAAERTTFTYTGTDGKSAKGKLLGGELEVTEGAYGENAEGQRVLRFTVEFVINKNALKFDSFDEKKSKFGIERPGKQNVTDSYIQIPGDMFAQKAKDEEAKQ